jgi:hypothetical protein
MVSGKYEDSVTVIGIRVPHIPDEQLNLNLQRTTKLKKNTELKENENIAMDT